MFWSLKIHHPSQHNLFRKRITWRVIWGVNFIDEIKDGDIRFTHSIKFCFLGKGAKKKGESRIFYYFFIICGHPSLTRDIPKMPKEMQAPISILKIFSGERKLIENHICVISGLKEKHIKSISNAETRFTFESIK